MQPNSKITLGWREWIALPDLGIQVMRAKVDTGARTSSLHVERQWRLTNEGAPWVGFEIKPRRDLEGTVEAFAPILDERVVADSGGHRAARPFFETQVWLGGALRTIEVNLADRKGMLFPFLVGRRALSGFIVNPKRSFLHGRPEHTSSLGE